jgi:hypothetical protein
MQNVNITISEDRKMTIVVDLTKEFGRSKSGKTIIIASTQGNANVAADGVMLGLNCYKYPD